MRASFTLLDAQKCELVQGELAKNEEKKLRLILLEQQILLI